MKKKALIFLVCIVALLLLFLPIPLSPLQDGGTRQYVALTYKIVCWNRITENGTYTDTKVYFGADHFRSIDELWEELQKSETVDPAQTYDSSNTTDKIITDPPITTDKTDTDTPESDTCTSCDDIGIDAPRKPVIYLYPEEETEVSVSLSLNGYFTCTYPAYRNGWRVTAQPDGTLRDAHGMEYSYLYWEGILHTDWDMTKGFCIKGEDTAAFLEEALAKLGLNRREANEFIVYWLPLMQENPYNIISFQTDAYTENAQLHVFPAPDTVIRVFMVYKPCNAYVEMTPQTLTAPNRHGFTVVEWGGTPTN